MMIFHGKMLVHQRVWGFIEIGKLQFFSRIRGNVTMFCEDVLRDTYGNIMNYIWIEEECSRSVPIRHVPLHRQDHGLSIDYPIIH